jgi:hypothetical protein
MTIENLESKEETIAKISAVLSGRTDVSLPTKEAIIDEIEEILDLEYSMGNVEFPEYEKINPEDNYI